MNQDNLLHHGMGSHQMVMDQWRGGLEGQRAESVKSRKLCLAPSGYLENIKEQDLPPSPVLFLHRGWPGPFAQTYQLCLISFV